MKHIGRKGFLFLLTLALLLSACCGAMANEAAASPAFSLEYNEAEGIGESFVLYPAFGVIGDTEPGAVDPLNALLNEKAHIPAYLQLLSALQEGGADLQVRYDTSNAERWNEANSCWALPRFVSILISAQGKMLSGPPSQVYYPITVDVQTGKEVSFDQLFTDPDGAKVYIEQVLTEQVAPTLSTYLENSELFPVPYDRYFLDGMGNVIIVYEKSQLSFLSGFAGAVAFRYSELWDYLDTAADGVAMQVLWHPDKYLENAERDASFAEKQSEWLYNDSIYGLGVDLYVGSSLADVLEHFRAVSDSGFYPGGAYYEVEDARLRGTLILTDEKEETVTGILTARVDHFGINTGKTTLEEAIALMEQEPLARLPIGEAAAELYRVCPGEAALYENKDMEGRSLSFTLYADDAGVVQYIKLAMKP